MRAKLLILTTSVKDYRVDIFNLLNVRHDLTVAFTEEKYKTKTFLFNTIYTPGFAAGPLFIHHNNLNKLAMDYDVVIGEYNVRMFSIMSLALRKRNYKLIFWGIGVSASYNKKFDKNKTWDNIRLYFGKKADALIFYSDYPIKRHIGHGLKPEQLFVANNTMAVSEIDLSDQGHKTDLLFIGTLYSQKGLDILINSYSEVLRLRNNVPHLNIVGSGPMGQELRKIVDKLKLNENIKLLGPVYDKEKLKEIFARSIACISPNQAGLSVLTSMGHGVPFVTSKGALTGGEIFNIHDKVNGILYDEGQEDLTKTLLWILDNRDMMLNMGLNAYAFYINKRRPEQMVSSISDAVEYVLEA
ncbi:MAG: glycosyltransferase family 4 protein [Bacteroidales bacterium]|nr:glycosyltransferase family 4 protein [Bacteroidales bacterium]